jgi:hypothetical protein
MRWRDARLFKRGNRISALHRRLLRVAVNAHGGLSRWDHLKTVKAGLSITGAIWQVKRQTPEDDRTIYTDHDSLAHDGSFEDKREKPEAGCIFGEGCLSEDCVIAPRYSREIPISRLPGTTLLSSRA